MNIVIQKVLSMDEKLEREFNPLLDEGTVWNTENGHEFLSNQDNALFVAFADDQPAGFVTAHRLQRFDRKKAEVLLYEIGVQEPFRKQGIGKALIERVKEWAREAGAQEVWVLTEASNEAAMALYRSTGGRESEPGITMFTYTVDPPRFS